MTPSARAAMAGGQPMCADGVDLGHVCRLCGKPLLSCWDDGPSISWHMYEADGEACRAKIEARIPSHTVTPL